MKENLQEENRNKDFSEFWAKFEEQESRLKLKIEKERSQRTWESVGCWKSVSMKRSTEEQSTEKAGALANSVESYQWIETVGGLESQTLVVVTVSSWSKESGMWANSIGKNLKN